MAIAVSLVEHSPELRESLAALLNRSPRVRCKKCYASSEEALTQIPLSPPDVLLMDINLPGLNGIECVAKLKPKLPELQVLMLTRYEQNDLVFDSICAGASGYVLKNTPGNELIEVIEQVHAGGSPMTMQVARKVIDFARQAGTFRPESEELTPREKALLARLAKGDCYAEIGLALDIGVDAVRAHLHSIYQKIHIKSRARRL